ncbi:MAG: glucose-6-phosphate dehydrogenase [Ilumatobacteraceae bacterium]
MTTDAEAHDEPTIFVLYGATGDLAKRMVIPAFYTLALQGLMPEQWLLVGNGRGDVAHEDFRQHVHDVLTEFGTKPEGADWEQFSKRLLFAGGGFDSDDPGSLLDVLEQAKATLMDDRSADGDGESDRDGESNVRLIHYFAVPPTAFIDLTKAIGKHQLTDGSRVIYEKPFGESAAGFRELDKVVHTVLDESQVFRIDHFVGKEAVQQLHALRFANGMFSGIWNREHVRAVQIDVPEDLDIADRAAFYDATGALRDMIVTHLFQVAAEIAMEPPVDLSAEGLQDARETVIAAFRPLDPAETVFGQFEGYLDVEGIDADSTTDTFVAARMWVDTDRWRDVPFLLRTGKQLAKSAERVSMLLRVPQDGPYVEESNDNVLSFTLSGSGAIILTVGLKKPGVGLEFGDATVKLKLDDVEGVEGAEPLAPYVRLIHDVIVGDRSLFTRSDGLASAWAAVAKVMEHPPTIETYPIGSWGPPSADVLAEPDGWLVSRK